jgi:SAM-dependent methyltransferase
MGDDLRDWVSFWDRPHSIYVNARHLDQHYRDIAAGILNLLPRDGLRVLDYGCGEAVHADSVAARAQLTLSDSSASVRGKLAQRFAGNTAIAVASPDDVARFPDGAFDLIVTNSVVQYLSPAELDRLLALWRRLLATGGALVVGDVIPPQVSALSDVRALLGYARRHGFLLAALAGLVRTALSPYRRLRSRLGIACYTEADFLQRLTAAGFAGERLTVNLEHNPARMTFRAVPAGATAPILTESSGTGGHKP